MATSLSVCVVCDLQHQTTQSTDWCIECEEPLCSACKQHHNVLKATRNHETISISDYQLLPAVVTDIKQNCVHHNEMYQLYCNKHESPICNKCVKDHGKCGEILSLDELGKNIKNSESFVDLQHSLDDLLDNINQIRKDKESNMERITEQKTKIAAEVCHIKKKVIQHVNKLEEEFIRELDQIELKYCNPIRSSVSSLQDRTKEINQLKSEIKNTKKYGSNLQTFLNRFGYFNVKTSPSPKIELQRRKDRQAQINVSKAINSINNVKLELIRKCNTTCEFSSGCCVTKTGEFLFTNYEDNNDKLTAINVKGKVEYTIPIREPYSAFDFVIFDDSTVAVSTGYSHIKPGISIVDLTKKIVFKFIDLPGIPYGITYDGKALICCVEDKGLHVISCTDYSITTIPNTGSLRYSYVTTHADKIFFTNPDNHTVSCCLYSGVHIWEFEDKRVLDDPRGITIDNKGNVFVVGRNTCNVVVISPDGKHCKQILTKDDGLDRPTTLFFDKLRNQLLVTNLNRSAYGFNVSYI
ncbi:unnamed protein product [Mytilus edulis]|uniref:B box-type domain-containing protein n=1 Tax=Mytilus edulis TaxID=6550 RepID=A0A8S3TMV7_MYTED|nr:unnamed protein product [Mytilus edulis]